MIISSKNRDDFKKLVLIFHKISTDPPVWNLFPALISNIHVRKHSAACTVAWTPIMMFVRVIMTSVGWSIQKGFRWFSSPLHQTGSHTGVSQLSTSPHDAPAPLPRGLPHSSCSPLTLQSKVEWISNSEEIYKQNVQGAIKKNVEHGIKVTISIFLPSSQIPLDITLLIINVNSNC